MYRDIPPTERREHINTAKACRNAAINTLTRKLEKPVRPISGNASIFRFKCDTNSNHQDLIRRPNCSRPPEVMGILLPRWGRMRCAGNGVPVAHVTVLQAESTCRHRKRQLIRHPSLNYNQRVGYRKFQI